MPTSPFWSAIRDKRLPFGSRNQRYVIKVLATISLVLLLWLSSALLSFFPQVQALSSQHTSQPAGDTCNQVFYSTDSNPYPLCPGPLPKGGDCTWWAWEQWHLLGYNIPYNFGNAADWIASAERFGLAVGKMPRVGAIAVFPIADHYWAYSSAGHLAFVTWVSPDGSTFNVTYENYSDPTPMYIGTDYNVSLINEPRFQNGNLRFIYFPQLINPALFARLPGIDGNSLGGVARSNSLLVSSSANSVLATSRIALGLPPESGDQEFNADFTGSGLSELLLYNRQQGRLDILSLSNKPLHRLARLSSAERLEDAASEPAVPQPQIYSLSDATTPVNGWGSSLDIHVGDFAGTGQSDILLYDRVTGEIQLLSLTPQFTIKQHVTLPGWGPNWELYVGRFDGQRTDVFMYNRFANYIQ